MKVTLQHYKNRIKFLEVEIINLKKEMQNICPHTNIITDEIAQSTDEWIVIKNCEDCGKYWTVPLLEYKEHES